jgi:hypothetical protein
MLSALQIGESFSLDINSSFLMAYEFLFPVVANVSSEDSPG